MNFTLKRTVRAAQERARLIVARVLIEEVQDGPLELHSRVARQTDAVLHEQVELRECRCPADIPPAFVENRHSPDGRLCGQRGYRSPRSTSHRGQCPTAYRR